jgi:excinuclease ABC subunit A
MSPAAPNPGRIEVRGARVHNLRGVDADLPHHRLITITGVSGSGKSSFAFDTVFREGERRFLLTLAAHARLKVTKLERPEVDTLRGLGPALAIGQRLGAPQPRSIVGTATGLWDSLRLILARFAAHPGGVLLTRAHFSFNDPEGACPTCAGLGVVDRVDPDRIVADPRRTLRGGALVPTLKNGYTVYSQVTVDVMNGVCKAHGFDVDTPWQDLTDEQRGVIFYGSNRLVVPFGKHSLESRLKWSGITAKPREEGHYRGLIPVIEETLRRDRNDNILRFVRSERCDDCGGSRLGPVPRAARLGDLGATDLLDAALDDLEGRLSSARAALGSPNAREAFDAIFEPLQRTLHRLLDLGLGHLPLGRGAPSLSNGERQRIRIAQQLDDDLSGLTYVFDEPSVDLHPIARDQLQDVLRRLVDAGDTVITVEHDPDVIRRADHVLELGPGPGRSGGRALFSGPPRQLEGRDTPTGRALAAALPAPLPARDNPSPLWVRGARARNLTGIDVPFLPCGLNVVTGVSGAGKTTLVADVLAPALARALGDRRAEPGAHDRLEGHEAFQQVLTLEARPIGRTPRSNPATYTGLFDVVRKAFAATDEAKARGLTASRFSFNTKGGRCPRCEGAGVERVRMHGLGDVSVTCPACEGRRFDEETLSVLLLGRSIAEVLELDVDAARAALEGLPSAHPFLDALATVGLGYLPIGQPASALSGGEAQRVRLATELARPTRGPTLYVLDEPSRGLHPEDLPGIIGALRRLTEAGHTVVAVEHDPRIWQAADWRIDLGPGAGHRGGRLAYAGPPARAPSDLDHPTARVLRGERARTPRPAAPARPAVIRLEGVRTHNLRGLDVEVSKGALTVVLGPSGAGKSSLAFDSLAAEANHRLTGRLGAHVRRLAARLPRPQLDRAQGLTPTVALRQRPPAAQPRSTVGTLTEVQDLLRLMFSRLGTPAGRTAGALSFNTEAGACPECTGLGFVRRADLDALLTDPSRPALGGAFAGTKIGARLTDPGGQHAAILRAAADRAELDVEAAFEALAPAARRLVLEGDGGPALELVWRFRRGKRTGEHALTASWPGLLGLVQQEYANTQLGKGARLEAVMRRQTCAACEGARLGPRAREVKLAGVDLGSVAGWPTQDILPWIDGLTLDGEAPRAALAALRAELAPRLEALTRLGLGHLAPNRGADTLSSGERMRVELAAQLAAPSAGITFVFDEPSRGLHPRDVQGLLAALRRLVDQGQSTVVLVDHHRAVRRAADHVIALGPGAGPDGGALVYAGPARGAPAAVDEVVIAPPAVPEAPPIRVRGAREHNLRDLDLELPGAGLTALVGPSGAGKSTLLWSVLGAGRAEGLERFGATIELPVAPPTGGSSVAAELGVLETIRARFVRAPEAKAKKLGKSAFALGPAGRCPACKGAGRVTIPLDFLADAESPCEPAQAPAIGRRSCR